MKIAPVITNNNNFLIKKHKIQNVNFQKQATPPKMQYNSTKSNAFLLGSVSAFITLLYSASLPITLGTACLMSSIGALFGIRDDFREFYKNTLEHRNNIENKNKQDT